jgi:hypothetical protein
VKFWFGTKKREKSPHELDHAIAEAKRQLQQARTRTQAVKKDADVTREHMRENHLGPAIRKALGGS